MIFLKVDMVRARNSYDILKAETAPTCKFLDF